MLALVLAAVLASSPPPDLDAPEHGVTLDWEAPAACPQQPAMNARLDALLPGEGSNAGVPLAVVATVTGADEFGEGRWEVELVFEGERGRDRRQFGAEDCEALADAVALVIAVALDPVGVTEVIRPAVERERQRVPKRGQERGPEPEPEPADPLTTINLGLADPELVQERDPPPARRTEHDLQFVGAALGGGGYGPLRLGEGLLGVELGIAGPHWRASLRGLWLAPRVQTVAGGQGRFEGFDLAGRGCGVPTVGRVEFPICVGVHGGRVRGRGQGATPEPQGASLPWAAISAGFGLRWDLGPLALGVDLELLATVVRGGFSIAGTSVQEFAPIGVHALTVVEFRLPAHENRPTRP